MRHSLLCLPQVCLQAFSILIHGNEQNLRFSLHRGPLNTCHPKTDTSKKPAVYYFIAVIVELNFRSPATITKYSILIATDGFYTS